MPALLDSIHAIALVSCFALLGTSRIGACIRWLSLQGILLGLVPLITHDDGVGLRVLLLARGNPALKGAIFPGVLLRQHAPFLMLQTAIFVVSIGLFMSISRRSGRVQDIGYLMLENGILVFGVITP